MGAGYANDRKRGGDGGGGRASKRKYFQNTFSRKEGIPLGSRGILISCAGGKENIAAREAVDIFTQIYESEHPEAADRPACTVEGSKDVAALLAAETEALRDTEKKLFYYHATGIHSTVYVEVKYAGSPSPSELVTRACEKAKSTRCAGTKLCNRFYPIESTCYASLDKIQDAAQNLAATCFPETESESHKGVQFAVQYEHRAAPGLNRMEVIDAVVASIKTPPNKVNLSSPDKTILVNVLKTTCGLAIVDDFKQLQKYNVQLLASPPEEDAATPTEEKPASAPVGEEGHAALAPDSSEPASDAQEANQSTTAPPEGA